MKPRALMMALIPVLGLAVVSIASATNLQLTSEFGSDDEALDGKLHYDCDLTSNGKRVQLRAIAAAYDKCKNPVRGTTSTVTTTRSGFGSSQAVTVSDDATTSCGGPTQHTGWIQYLVGTSTWRNYPDIAASLSGCWNSNLNNWDCTGQSTIMTINTSQTPTGACASHQYAGVSIGNTLTQ